MYEWRKYGARGNRKVSIMRRKKKKNRELASEGARRDDSRTEIFSFIRESPGRVRRSGPFLGNGRERDNGEIAHERPCIFNSFWKIVKDRIFYNFLRKKIVN